MKKFKNIPTNIITGFLGVGKTTVIRHLLKTKPEAEKWAVLVNEFGEVGIDGALLANDGIAVKEVPGGCMCCAVGLPSKVAMNDLIRKHKPDRIIIEPTGLAHPQQILQQFSGPEFQGVLDMQAMVCLVDLWCLSSDKFKNLAAFNEQIALADVVLASKSEVAEEQHLQKFRQFSNDYKPAKQHWGEISLGQMNWQLLTLERGSPKGLASTSDGHSDHHTHSSDAESDGAIEFDQYGIAQLENQTEFAHSCGWVFDRSWQFDSHRLQVFIEGLDVPRVKGFFNTPKGYVAINKMRDQIALEWVDAVADSSVEMISMEPTDWTPVAQALQDCRAD